MIYREYYNDRGIILIDILLALTLCTLFIALISQSTFGARDLFYRAKERERLIDIYEAHTSDFDDLLPYQSRTIYISSEDSITGRALWYGNDRIETIIEVSASNTPPLKNETLTFVKIHSFTRSGSMDTAGAPLCSVDFTNKEVVGSYGYLEQLKSSAFERSVIGDTALVTAVLLPISATLPLTDLEVRGSIAYVAVDSTVASDPDLLVFNIEDSTHPVLISSINTGPGIAALAIAGRRIFAAAASTAAQLHIIRADFTEGPPLALSLVLEKKFQLPLPYATATPPFASSIFYNQQKIYLGTEKWDGEEFAVIDVTNPYDPRKIGGLEIGSKVNDILVHDMGGSTATRNLAYIAAADEKQLRVVDVSSPPLLTLVSSASPSGWQRQEGKTVSLFEDSLSLGRTSGGFNISQDHEIFTWATTSATNLSLPYSADRSGGIYGIIVDRHNLFMVSRQTGKEFQVEDRTLGTTTLQYIPLPISPGMMTCDGDSIYILGRDAPALYKIDFHQP